MGDNGDMKAKKVYFSVAREPQLKAFDVDGDWNITTKDVEQWAQKRGYADAYVKLFPDVMASLLKMDAISYKLYLDYRQYFAGRTCNDSPWDKHPNEKERIGKLSADLHQVIRMKEKAHQEMSTAVIGSAMLMVDHLTYDDIKLFGGSLNVFEKMQKEILKAALNERRQIGDYSTSAINVLTDTVNGPGGIGVIILYDQWANLIRTLEKETLASKADNETVKMKQYIIRHGYDQHLVYGLAKYGPAAEAGINVGDRILEINGKKTDRMNGADILRQMRGVCGEKVRLTLSRDGRIFKRSVPRNIENVPYRLFQTDTDLISTLYMSEFGSAK